MSLAHSTIDQLSQIDPKSAPKTDGAAGIGAKSLLALTLALLLALAAIDTAGTHTAAGIENGPGPILDGRGKWSGYLG